MKNTSYAAEPDPAFIVRDEPPPWRVRAWKPDEPPWTVCQGMTEEEARACEEALQGTSGAAPVDELERRNVRSRTVRIVESSHDGPVEVSGAPFVPYDDQSVANVAEVAQMVIDKKMAPSPRMVEGLARALLTVIAAGEAAGRADATTVRMALVTERERLRHVVATGYLQEPMFGTPTSLKQLPWYELDDVMKSLARIEEMLRVASS